MRCCSCNKNLNDSESTRRIASTGIFLDMCNKCYKDIADEVPTISRYDLNPYEEIEEQLEDWTDETDD
jgi:hypothetical protein